MSWEIKRYGQKIYMIAIKRRSFLGSILDDLWCRGRPSGVSFDIDESFRGGTVTGRDGNALDQNGIKALRNLCLSEPTMKNLKNLNSKFIIKEGISDFKKKENGAHIHYNHKISKDVKFSLFHFLCLWELEFFNHQKTVQTAISGTNHKQIQLAFSVSVIF